MYDFFITALETAESKRFLEGVLIEILGNVCAGPFETR